jgi:hypothetical protein
MKSAKKRRCRRQRRKLQCGWKGSRRWCNGAGWPFGLRVRKESMVTKITPRSQVNRQDNKESRFWEDLENFVLIDRIFQSPTLAHTPTILLRIRTPEQHHSSLM